MTILLSGGLSELSNALAEHLLSRGNRVLILHNYCTNSKLSSTLDPFLRSGELEILNIDNQNQEALLATFHSRHVTKIVDCSLHANTPISSPLAGAQHLLLGATCLLDAIRHYDGVQCVVLVSGEEVYGDGVRIRDETRALHPVSFGGAAQMSVEAMVHSYAVSYRIPVVIGRLPAILLGSSAQFERRIDALDDSRFVSVLRVRDAAEGVACLLGCSEFAEPAEVFNVCGGIEYSVADLRNKSGVVGSRQGGLVNQKVSQRFGWNVSPISPDEFYASCTIAKGEVEPRFLVYGGESILKSEFLRLLHSRGISFVESKIDLESSGDLVVHQEILDTLPSHLIYFSTNTTPFDGDCLALRSNVSTNLYIPWLVASEAHRASLHFTHIATNLTPYANSAMVVKGEAERMMTQFENALLLRVGPCVSSTPHPENLLVKIREHGVGMVGETSVTILDDCLPILLEMAKNKESGIHNLVNPGTINLKDLQKICGIDGGNNNSKKTEDLHPMVIENPKNLKISQNARESIQKCATNLFLT